MRKKALVASVVSALVIGASGVAGASPIFQDDFNGENAGNEALNFSSFNQWTVVPGTGTVDLIGNGGTFDFLPGNGLYVDLDGSTGLTGLLQSKSISAPAGNYVLSFDLAGSHRGTTESVSSFLPNELAPAAVSSLSLNLGNVTQILNIASNQGFQTYDIPFSLATPGSFSIAFRSIGGNGDNIGALLDNVSIAPVPEPSTILLLASGFFGVAIYGKRRKNNTT
ncbi:PEP-CTERM sorting domain-containing protein [Citrifermentans bremense]|uniref:PEP-CTERM sorting domain-containing protein n=1 Tax=Citrifermentans bremense TaxID=60035 RepID=UPI0009FD2DC2|nr:PEP-CTERM sorting domain-containing protein [Citrifermentans bremense]